MKNTAAAKASVEAGAERGEAARKKLIEAGLKIFSEVGYEAASTRALAAAAGVNIAAIPYYFRSKEGLYHAVIDYIIDYYQTRIGAGLQKMREILGDKKATPAQCRAQLDDYIRMLLRLSLQENRERARMSHIYIREQLDPTSAFARLYEGCIRESHDRLAVLIRRCADMKLSAEESMLVAQTLFGQMSAFKLSRQTILHDMGWKQYGEKGTAEIERIVMCNLDAMLSAYQKKGARP